MRNFFRGLWAMLRLRCPRCQRGRVFRGLFAMNDPCPECGLIFQREEGTFLGAMYVSYVLANIFMISTFFCLCWLLDWGEITTFFVTLALYVPLIPLVFRYSRVMWLYFERLGNVNDVSTTCLEEVRRQELRQRHV
jgi:uncharacterized protein (DUF983 family)